MQMKRYIVSLVFLFLINSSLIGQNYFFEQPVFSISFISHSVGIPFKDYFKKPLNFGVSFAADFGYNDKNFQKLELGWYHHANLNRALWVKTDYVRRFQTEQGFVADLQTGLGYMIDFSNWQVYELDKNGIYQKGKSRKGGLLIGAGFGAGYRSLLDEESIGLTPFINYQSMIQVPYGKILPIFPHNLLSIGTRFQMLK
ncbi:MAG: hypothetical protein ACI85O_001502 [Saprospiraceae bacterium]|jgi:hypothetical protein